MIIAKINVNGAIAHTVYRKVIPAGVIGAQVEFEYAEDVWSGLHKTVVFRGPVTKDVVTDANIVTIPPEVVEKPLYPLSVGVYGVDADGNLAIPTIWADLGIVRESANPSGDTTTDPSLPVWAQIKQIADEAKQQALSVQNDADSGAFDGAPGHTPEYGVDYCTPEQIAGIANQAAEILQPDVSQIKSDLASKEPLHKVLSATLVTGETSLAFTDDAITDNAMIYIYTNVWGVQPSAVDQSGNTLALTFDAQSSDIGVKVEVR